MADYKYKVNEREELSEKPSLDWDDDYSPKNKEHRKLRRKIAERFKAMRESPMRMEAEKEWDLAEKDYRMWAPPRDPMDWRSNIVLPDTLAALQAYMKESIMLKHRPELDGVEFTDKPRAFFVNSVFTYSMDRTGYDYHVARTKNSTGIHGTGVTVERYRYEKRTIQDMTMGKDGNITYTKKEVVDKDDTYTERLSIWDAYFDPSAEHIDDCVDFIERAVMPHDEFKRIYEDREQIFDVDKVRPAGQIKQGSAGVKFFVRAADMKDNDVELLHYYNRATDTYGILANNVLIRDHCIPFKHKELPVAVWYFIPIDGSIYGYGIPRIMRSVKDERQGLKNAMIDRNKLQINKFFFLNDLFNVDEDELTPRPHGLVKIRTNGLPLSQVVQPLEYGDMPASTNVIDQELKEDERRAHGIDERNQGIQQGGTATEAAILSENSQKAIALVNEWANLDTIIRVGRLKWSNVQFFYPTPRVERTFGAKATNETKYRKIKVKDQEFLLETEGEGKDAKNKLTMNELEGSFSFELDSAHASFMEGDWDIQVKVNVNATTSKAIKQQRETEMFEKIINNPNLAGEIDKNKALRTYLQDMEFDPRNWMKGQGLTVEMQIQQAEAENALMSSGYAIPPTKGITEEHVKVHLYFTDSVAYDSLPQTTKTLFEEHIKGEGKELGLQIGEGEEGQPSTGGAPPGQPGGPAIDPATAPNQVINGNDVTQTIAPVQ